MKFRFIICVGMLWVSALKEVGGSGNVHTIETIHCMSDIPARVKRFIEPAHASEKKLSLWDVDLTIFHGTHPATHAGPLYAHWGCFEGFFPCARAQILALNLSSQVTTPVLVEPETPRVIAQLQSWGISCLALTSALAGPLGDFARNEVAKAEALKARGIYFEESFSAQDIVFDELPSYFQQHPVYHQGLLCTNGERKKDPHNPKSEVSKGNVFVQFLKAVGLQVEWVVVVDDRWPALHSLSGHLHAYNPEIRFLGLHYQPPPDTVSEQDFCAFWGSLQARVKAELARKIELVRDDNCYTPPPLRCINGMAPPPLRLPPVTSHLPSEPSEEGASSPIEEGAEHNAHI